MPGKSNYHWAEDIVDINETACGQQVDHLITHGEDVTTDKDNVIEDPDACDGCLKVLQAEQQVS